MADVVRLRDKIVELARDPRSPSSGKFTPSDLHTRLSRFHRGHPPVARATFYTWFAPGAVPKQAFVECIPAFADIFDVDEHVLWQAAGVFPPELKVSSALASSAHYLRAAHRQIAATLADSGLSAAGEALVVGRIIDAALDYRMSVWPVVRGTAFPLHLHSWIVLQPLDDPGSRPRPRTAQLEAVDRAERRRALREDVIGEGLWRTLGLNWRHRVPEEHRRLGPLPLFIEVPVEERSRRAPEAKVHDELQVERVLVLGAPWAHAELMAALLADALGFGSVDLRYLGHPAGHAHAYQEQFTRERLGEAPPYTSWAIAQRADMMERLRPDILKAARRHFVVVVTYGPGLAAFVAREWWAQLPRIVEAIDGLDALASEIGRETDVVRVQIDDSDAVGDDVNGPPELVRHRMADLIRLLAAGVLNVIYDRRMGPPVSAWGEKFDDCRVADERRARIPTCASTVRWVPRGST